MPKVQLTLTQNEADLLTKKAASLGYGLVKYLKFLISQEATKVLKESGVEETQAPAQVQGSQAALQPEPQTEPKTTEPDLQAAVDAAEEVLKKPEEIESQGQEAVSGPQPQEPAAQAQVETPTPAPEEPTASPETPVSPTSDQS